MDKNVVGKKNSPARRDTVKRNSLAVPRIAWIEKVANLENDIASL